MAVRIALQCSESDAHLILSEHNSAAKLLSRPGEAIYNDANGSVEGNHFFQVVWLSDERREAYLKQLRDLAVERKPISEPACRSSSRGTSGGRTRPQPDRSGRCSKLPSWPKLPPIGQAWLGDPVAIKDPTAALFRRQGGNHLLIVGQNAEGALGIMAASLDRPGRAVPAREVRNRPARGPLPLLDGTPEDDPHAETSPRWPERSRATSRSSEAGERPPGSWPNSPRRSRAASSPTPTTAPKSSS